MAVKRVNNMIIGVCAEVGMGKTYWKRHNVLNPAYKNGKRIMSWHSSDHADYQDFHKIKMTEMKAFLQDKNARNSPVFCQIHDYKLAVNTFNQYVDQIHAPRMILDFDDSSEALGDGLSKSFKRLLTQNKNRNYDVLLGFHSLDLFNRRSYKMLNYLVVGKTQDSLKDAKNYLPLGMYKQYEKIYPKLKASRKEDHLFFTLKKEI